MKNAIRSAVAALLAIGSAHAADTERLGALSPNSRVTTEAGYVTITARVESARALLDRKADDAMAYARGVSNSLASSSRTAINVASNVYDRLDAKLGIEAERRQAGDAAVAATVQGAYDYATAVSNRLQSGVNANAAAIQTASNTLAAAMNQDRANRVSADAALNVRVDNALNYGQSVSNTLSQQIASVSNYIDNIRADIPDTESTVAEAVRQANEYTTAISNRVEGLRNITNGKIADERTYAEGVSNFYGTAVEDLHSRVDDAEDRTDSVSNALAQADSALSDRIDSAEDGITAVSNVAVAARTELRGKVTAVSNAFETADSAIREDIDAKVAQIYSDMSGMGVGGGPSYVPDTPYVSVAKVTDYLYEIRYDREYPDDEAAYVETAYGAAGCSSFRTGGIYGRSFDWLRDTAAEFVIRMSAASNRHASVGIALAGTNITDRMALTAGWSDVYKALPALTVDGINDAGVVCNLNVVHADSVKDARWHGSVNGRVAVRRILDGFSNAYAAAQWAAANVTIPPGATAQGFSYHFMIADPSRTFIVEDGVARELTGPAAMTNFRMFNNSATLRDTRDQVKVYDPYGSGLERYAILMSGMDSVTDVESAKPLLDAVLFTKAYPSHPQTADPPWYSEFTHEPSGLSLSSPDTSLWAAAQAVDADYASGLRDGACWQSVHSSVYDITNRVLVVRVQESGDWYEFPIVAPAVDKLAPATADELGGVRVGYGLGVSADGVLTSAVTTNEALAVKAAHSDRMSDSQKTTLLRKIVEYIKAKEGVDLEND